MKRSTLTHLTLSGALLLGLSGPALAQPAAC